MLRRAFIAALAAAALAGCDEITAGGETGLAGTYTLRTVNGAPLPAALTGYTCIVGGTLTVDQGSAFTTQRTTAQVDGGSTHVDRMSGTVRHAGGTLERVIPAGVIATGAVSEGGLRVTSTADRAVYVYER